MSKRRYYPHLATLFFLLTLLVVILSWIFDVYGMTVNDPHTGEQLRIQSLLSSEGLRWLLRNAITNFTGFPPLGWGIVVLFGAGVVWHSGFTDAALRTVTHGRISHRERRSLALAVIVEIIYIALILFATFSPWGIFLSVAGGLVRSPFMEGLLFLVSLGVALLGISYGLASGRYKRDSNLVDGMTGFAQLLSVYLVIVFFAAQLFACLEYSHINNYLLQYITML
ncbi:MAG: AbgT family transporter [Mediterranea sp.]|jgi:aminobenzoyl-glutamate transport protein|nr:AbgT family transporter [Mediterranea sp.]